MAIDLAAVILPYDEQQGLPRHFQRLKPLG
jgi:hypothetical protein